jgi:Protein of unknown function (DUF2628)
MKIYTVHEPRLRKDEVAPDPDRFRFIRDGFYFWAFLLGPVWMLWHRLWLVLVIYLVGTTAIQWGLFALGVPGVVKFAVGFLIALLIGFEGGSLRRWSLRRRFTQVGVVAARDLEEAERRFFEEWTGEVSPPAPARDSYVPPPPFSPVSPSSPDVLGLFPQPEPRTRP